MEIYGWENHLQNKWMIVHCHVWLLEGSGWMFIKRQVALGSVRVLNLGRIDDSTRTNMQHTITINNLASFHRIIMTSPPFGTIPAWSKHATVTHSNSDSPPKICHLMHAISHCVITGDRLIPTKLNNQHEPCHSIVDDSVATIEPYSCSPSMENRFEFSHHSNCSTQRWTFRKQMP